MPNHIDNSLKFSFWGDEGARIAALRVAIGSAEQPIDFEKIIPQPRGIQDPDPRFLSEAEFDWNTRNWGTKWNAYSVKIEDEDDEVFWLRFQTAWNWPEPIIRKILRDFPGINVTYVAAGEGEFFAVYIDHSEDGSHRECIWTKDNDPTSLIRDAMTFALHRPYMPATRIEADAAEREEGER